MPSVIEMPEIKEDEQEQPSHDTVEVTLSLRPSFVNKIAALLSVMATGHRQRSQQEGQELQGNQKQEMLVDILAREHPYIYIKALAG